MIKKPTVLVLGAGASQPYGFPSGATLVDQVCAQVLDAETGLTAKGLGTRLESEHREVRKFASQLRKARPFSIDAFLETRPEFLAVGKAAIADVLLRAEFDSTVETASPDVDWYRYLLNKILLPRSPDHFSAQAKLLEIVTFNFDRSFELALFSTIRATYGLDVVPARQLATELRIHHVHGLLGQPEFLMDHPEATPYGPAESELNPALCRRAAESIKIVHEPIGDDVLEDAQAALGRARCVYFLGFGYDDRNLQKLKLPESIGSATVVRGTAYGLTTLEQMPVVRSFGIGRIRLESNDALGFLRTHAEALFD